METRGSAMSEVPAPPDPAPRRKAGLRVVLLLLLLLAVLVSILFVLRSTMSTSRDEITVKLISPPLENGSAVVEVENKRGGVVVICEPYRVQRKQSNDIFTFMGLPVEPIGGRTPKLPLVVSLNTGTNHGQWRVLVPVAPYGLFSGVERLCGIRRGTLRFKSRLLRSLSRRSERWVASDWFDEPKPVDRQKIDNPQNSHSLSSIVRKFASEHKRWPASFGELTSLAAAETNSNPDFSAFLEFYQLPQAVFSPTPDGGLNIDFPRGGLTLSAMPAPPNYYQSESFRAH